VIIKGVYLTDEDIADLKRSWGTGWESHTAGKTAAVEAGTALLRRMKGTGWKLHINENLGWHFKVINGSLCVYESAAPGHYFCMLGGELFWHCDTHSEDPNESVRMQLEAAERFVHRVTEEVEAIKKAVEG